jgi:hypothetical protein
MERVKNGRVTIGEDFEHKVTLSAHYLTPVAYGAKPSLDKDLFEESKQRVIKEFEEVVELWQEGYLDNYLDMAREARDMFE